MMFSTVSSIGQQLRPSRAARRGKVERRNRFRRSLQAEQLEDRRMLAQTVGVFVNEPEAYDGYTLFSPELVQTTYLINNEGELVHKWPSNYDAANMTYMQPDGSIWRAGSLDLSNVWPWNSAGVGGIVQQIGWDGDVLAEFRLARGTGNPDADSRILHHDIEVLPNGNVAMIAFDYMSRERALSLGRDPALVAAARENDKHLIPDSIVEVAFDEQGNGTIVWEWHVEDHFVQDMFPDITETYVPNVAYAPGKIDINYVDLVGPQADITHANGLDYIPELDQFILSVRSFSEIWVIDHNTVWDPANGDNEPAGSKGDLLYRWGNPAAYGAGDAGDRQSFFQHDGLWVPFDYPEVANPGSITLYNNGALGSREYSTVENIVPPYRFTSPDTRTADTFEKYELLQDPYGVGDLNIWAWGPVVPGDDWTTLAKFDTLATSPMESGDEIHFSAIISGAERMPNGNTVVTEGVTGTIFEVTPDNELVWEYVNPVVPGGVIQQGNPIPLVDFFPPRLNTHINFVFKARRYDLDYLEPGLIREPGDTAGLYDPATGTWYLNNDSDGSVDDLIVFQGDPATNSFIPISGDWDGDGIDTGGFYDNRTNTWYLNNKHNGELDDVIVLQGDPVDPSLQPIAGDWDGTSADGIRQDMPGLYDWRTNTWHLYHSQDPAAFQASVQIASGPNHQQRSWRPIAGDWDGDGVDSIGLYVPSSNIWYLNNENDGTIDNMIVVYGPRHNSPGWLPIAGDWNLDGLDSIGLYIRGANIWYLNNRVDGSVHDLFAFQGPRVPNTWLPITGNWNGSVVEGDVVPPPEGAEAEAEWVGAVTSGDYVRIDVAETELGQAPLAAGGLDANADGNITPADALTVINAVNEVYVLAAGSDQEAALYPDVNGDMLLSAADALMLINHLNQQAVRADGEGEGSRPDAALVDVPTAEPQAGDAPVATTRLSLTDSPASAEADVDGWRVTSEAKVGEAAELRRGAVAAATESDSLLEEILADMAEGVAAAWTS